VSFPPSLCCYFMHTVLRDVKLLSFGGEEGDQNEKEELVVYKKKSIVRPDCEGLSPSFSQLKITTAFSGG
jgi:hypothetical protein